jgi:hypothetical protein
VRERKLLTLEQALHKMTGLPARRLGWSERGQIAPGQWADVVVFDPESISERATFLEPHRHSVGVEHVLVRGRFVLRSGAMTGARPGRPIASVPSAATPETLLRRDLLALLEEEDAEIGLHVAASDGRWELSINADRELREAIRGAAGDVVKPAGGGRVLLLRKIRLHGGRPAVLGLAAPAEVAERTAENVRAKLERSSR